LAHQFISAPTRAIAQRDRHFAELTDAQMYQIESHMTELTYRKGENLCKQGAFMSNLIFIKSGLVKLFVEKEGSSSILFLKNANNFVGLPSLYGEGLFLCSAQALSETRVQVLNVEIFKQILAENARFAIDVIQIINEDMITAFDRVSSFSSKQLHGRLADLLLYLQDDIYKTNPFELTLSKTDLSEILFTSKESISRLFADLKKDNILEENKRVINILDQIKLRRISLTG